MFNICSSFRMSKGNNQNFIQNITYNSTLSLSKSKDTITVSLIVAIARFI